ncbi:MAG: nitric oxide reductase activation protein NorD [Methyloligella sp. ZOD6]
MVNAYRRHSLAIARDVGPVPAIALAATVSAIAIKSGANAAAELPWAALRVAERWKNPDQVLSWLSSIEWFASAAPESVLPLLGHMEKIVSAVAADRFEAWLLAGVRANGNDTERRRAFFTFEDLDAERWLQREAGEVLFADIEPKLKAYLTALWGLRLPMHEQAPGSAVQAARRATFGHGIVWMPATFRGYRGEQSDDIFRASLAHIGAHFVHSGARFAPGKLKPIQIALVSLIEDARIEQLAMEQYPGLRRLWLPFFTAQPSGARTAPNLLARLARALIDPDYEDSDNWIVKGRQLFFERRADWQDPNVSRDLGNLLGNDLGQMRIQFNESSCVVEPAYRDDNRGLWDFDQPPPPESEDSEMLFEAVRIKQHEEDSESPQDRDRDDQMPEQAAESKPAALKPVEDGGLLVARYPEYDYLTGRERPDWTTLVEYRPSPGCAEAIDRILAEQHKLVERISALIRSASVSRPHRMHRQKDGDGLDLDACIDATVDRRLGQKPGSNIFTRYVRRSRDLAVLVLLDISQSTNDRLRETTGTVLDIERQATAVLAEAMARVSDTFAIAAFCSNQRDDVRYYRIKDFGDPYDPDAHSSLAGLQGAFSTRMGAAIRHSGADLQAQRSHRRLLLVVTDGDPSDVDVDDDRYLAEDARRAVLSLAARGIDCFAVGLGEGGGGDFQRIFGARNTVQIARLESLPERLTALYYRLTV